MALITEETIRNEALHNIAQQIMIAARTAPKGKGRDTLYISMADGETIERIAVKMEEIGERENAHFFNRDAGNLRQCPAVIFIGTKILSGGLPACGFCGFENCSAKNQYTDVPCAFNNIDLGIALGSAVSMASVYKVDNRIMFSAGRAAIELGILPADIKVIFAIPLTATSKSPFFDRK